jgi:hypothetical protein
MARILNGSSTEIYIGRGEVKRKRKRKKIERGEKSY